MNRPISILVTDDETSIREVLAEGLESFGFRVTQAGNAAEAFAVVAAGGIDLVLSDMAPNSSGNRAVDQPRAMELAELALDFAQQALTPGGAFIAKLFQGEGFDGYLGNCRTTFEQVRCVKPKASRPRSPEVYLVGTGFRGQRPVSG